MAAAAPTLVQQDVLLLDTNILLTYVRDGIPSRRLEKLLELSTGRVQGLVSVVTVGEIHALSLKFGWGPRRREQLAELIKAKLVPVDIHRPEILSAYAEIDHYSEKVVKPARPMGQNDMWIAATAQVLGCELVTMDKDFDHLHEVKIRRRRVDLASLR